MSGFEFHLEGLEKFDAMMRDLPDKMDSVTRRTIREGAHAIERQAKINSTGPPRWKDGVNHPRRGGPGVVSGDHRRSIHVTGPTRWMGHGSGAWEARIGPSMIYSRRLELGMPGRTPPYPYLRPALEFVKRIVLPGLFERNWRRVLETGRVT